jgi:hypothetical protein
MIRVLQQQGAVIGAQREDRLGPMLLAAQRRRQSQQAARSVGRCVAYGAGAVPDPSENREQRAEIGCDT